MAAHSGIEIWKTIDAAPAYEVSDLGRVRRALAGSRTFSGRMVSIYAGRAGYAVVSLIADDGRRQFAVHRLVAAAFIGPCPVGQEVNHIDADRMNPAAKNLEYVTRSQNVLHAMRLGRISVPKQMSGVGNSNAKASPQVAESIRLAVASGETQKSLAARYGLS